MASSEYLHGGKNDRLYADDLTPGQTVVLIQRERWGGRVYVETWTVSRVLKSRLLLVSESGAEQRIVVQRGKYDDPRGEITGRPVGSDRYTPGVIVCTEDDPAVAAAVAEAGHWRRRSRATTAMNLALKDLNPETARTAARALVAYANHAPKTTK